MKQFYKLRIHGQFEKVDYKSVDWDTRRSNTQRDIRDGKPKVRLQICTLFF